MFFFGRVFGALAVARAFGDSRYKQPKTSQNFVSAEPFTKVVPLNPSHKYIIFACDGLWDVCTHEQAAEFVHNAFSAGKTTEQVAQDLVKHALDSRTEDNVTVVIVKITWDGESEMVVEEATLAEPQKEETTGVRPNSQVTTSDIAQSTNETSTPTTDAHGEPSSGESATTERSTSTNEVSTTTDTKVTAGETSTSVELAARPTSTEETKKEEATNSATEDKP